MRIVGQYSHLNGYEYLLVHKPRLWDEVQAVIAAVDAHQCKVKKSREKTKHGKVLYSPVHMNKQFRDLFRQKGWQERRVRYWVTSDERLIRKTLAMPEEDQKRTIEEAGHKPIYSYNQTDFVKDRVAAEVQFGKYAFVAYDLSSSIWLSTLGMS